MTKPTHDLHLDFETYCDLDLKQVGVHRYVQHASFRVLCAAWKIDEQPTQSATISSQLSVAIRMFALWDLLADRNYQGHAWNAAFENAVLARMGINPVHPLSCTMQRALAYGLPGRLETAAAALGVAAQKDMAGHRLMLQMSRPQRAGAEPWTTAQFNTLAAYCVRDVEAEAAVGAVIPKLSPEEFELSQLDARMNTDGGLGVDMTRVRAFAAVAAAAEKVDADRCKAITQGVVTSPGTQTVRLLMWLGLEGISLPDVARATVEEALLGAGPHNMPVLVAEVLGIRLRAARASTRKLERMAAMSEASDNSLRGQFQFCGAGRTGRWSGRGVQVQNLPRVPKGFSPGAFFDAALAAVMRPGDTTDLNVVSPAPVLDCVSWSLRSCLKATDDNMVLWSFDFAQIEARVLAWLAGQRDVLAVFASGMDVYVWAAAQFGSSDRQLGKVLVLALGFGMGAVKLRETALKSYGVRLTAAQAEKFKVAWRTANIHIVRFWYEMEAAATGAIVQRGRVHAVGGSGIAFQCTAKTLQMRLPSGRVLYYHGPRLDRDSGSIIYWGSEVGGRWVEQRTWGGKLAENATQAAARDIMSEAMLRTFRRIGAVPCMTVHDELVYPLGSAARAWLHLEALMLEPPPWAGGLPLAGENKVMKRYGVIDKTI